MICLLSVIFDRITVNIKFNRLSEYKIKGLD